MYPTRPLTAALVRVLALALLAAPPLGHAGDAPKAALKSESFDKDSTFRAMKRPRAAGFR